MRDSNMTEEQKRELTARGQICRPVGWSRRGRRKVLKWRRGKKSTGFAVGFAVMTSQEILRR